MFSSEVAIVVHVTWIHVSINTFENINLSALADAGQ